MFHSPNEGNAYISLQLTDKDHIYKTRHSLHVKILWSYDSQWEEKNNSFCTK